MVIRIEANQRQGRGFQIHLMDGPLDMLFDTESLDFYSAVACAGELLEALNREQGTALKLEDVLLIAGDGLEERARENVNAARMLEDIRSKKFTLSTPAMADVRKAVIDGEETYLLSGRGTVLTLYFCWRDDKNQNPDWDLVDIYADRGISGTSADKRDDFQRLLADCKRGLIDKVLVKSVSRFARNTQDFLKATRELNALGVEVCFEEQNIDSSMISGETLASIFAALAQKESESISQNMRMSYKRRMAQGTLRPWATPYGYMLQEKNLVVDESQAAIVRWIFNSYLDGKSMDDIADELNQKGITVLVRGTKRTWRNNTISYILSNERYVGDSLWQKTYATDSVPTIQAVNRGEKEKYYAYLMRSREVRFTFRGKPYRVEIAGANVFPQGFAAVASQIRDFQGVNMLCDIGNGTMNIMFINDRKPAADRMFTEKYGTHQCMLAVRENVMRTHHATVDDSIINRVLRFGTADIQEDYLTTIRETAAGYVREIFRILREREHNPALMRLHVLGGGSCLIRNFGEYDTDRVTICDDICATAKGYEYLCEMALRKGGDAHAT